MSGPFGVLAALVSALIGFVLGSAMGWAGLLFGIPVAVVLSVASAAADEVFRS